MAAGTETPEVLAGFLETAPDAMLVVRADGVIVTANARAERLFGTDGSAAGLPGRSVDELVPAPVADAHRAHRAAFWADPAPRVMGSGRDLVARRVDGGEFPVDVSLGTVDVGSDRFVVAAVRDITELVESQRALGASAFIVASSNDAIWVLDGDRIVRSWNEAAERLTGRRADDVVGRPAEHPFGLSDPARERDLLQRAGRGERIDRERADLVRADGSVVPVSIAMAAVRDTRGRVVGISGIARDITEEVTTQQTLAEVQRRVTETQRLADIGLWALDVDNDEVQWSEALHEIIGVSPRAFGGDLAAHLAPIVDDDRPRVAEALRTSIRYGKPFQAEYTILRPDGEERYLASRGDVTLFHGRVIAVSGIAQDLTDRQRLLDALRETDRIKDEFLGVVSHELRTPLTTIVGFARLLHEQSEGEAATWTSILVRNAEEMRSMVERILDFSRLQHGVELDVGSHPAALVVDEVLPLVSVPLAQHDLRIDVEDGLHVRVDRRAMDRVLVNLLTNSAQYAPPGTTVRLEAVGRPGGLAWIRVADEGCGIPGDQLENVFERFHQVASDHFATRHGVGVGLSIVKGYVEAMGGRVWIESEVDRGTTVTVEVPGG